MVVGCVDNSFDFIFEWRCGVMTSIFWWFLYWIFMRWLEILCFFLQGSFQTLLYSHFNWTTTKSFVFLVVLVSKRVWASCMVYRWFKLWQKEQHHRERCSLDISKPTKKMNFPFKPYNWGTPIKLWERVETAHWKDCNFVRTRRSRHTHTHSLFFFFEKLFCEIQMKISIQSWVANSLGILQGEDKKAKKGRKTGDGYSKGGKKKASEYLFLTFASCRSISFSTSSTHLFIFYLFFCCLIIFLPLRVFSCVWAKLLLWFCCFFFFFSFVQKKNHFLSSQPLNFATEKKCHRKKYERDGREKRGDSCREKEKQRERRDKNTPVWTDVNIFLVLCVIKKTRLFFFG